MLLVLPLASLILEGVNMSDSSVVGVLAEALAQHVPNMRGECDACAEPVHQPGALARHQASVVAALPNIAIVPRLRSCDGSETCNTNIHVHGCYADLGACDDPQDHVTASYHDGAARDAGGQA